ncbi:MAG: dihydroneopterin aldolase [Dysgonamonadaceae bacterium]|nr:dihydroneopterin aldolase [Dysgonamonadaceae bacterium]
MMNYIELKNMIFRASHGVFPQERKIGNIFTVDLCLYLDLSRAAESDNLSDAINYNTVFELVKAEMSIPSNLIENVAGRIIHSLKKQFPEVKKVKIRLAKANPPVKGQIDEAAVVIKT